MKTLRNAAFTVLLAGLTCTASASTPGWSLFKPVLKDVLECRKEITEKTAAWKQFKAEAGLTPRDGIYTFKPLEPMNIHGKPLLEVRLTFMTTKITPQAHEYSDAVFVAVLASQTPLDVGPKTMQELKRRKIIGVLMTDIASDDTPGTSSVACIIENNP